MWFKCERCSHPPGYEAVGLHKKLKAGTAKTPWQRGCGCAASPALWRKKRRKEVVCKNEQLKRKKKNKLQKYVR